jgi:c(7)-type cytochrome triheme protein
MIFIRLFFLSVILVVFGCTIPKKAATLEKHKGLETIPFYRTGDLSFDTRRAIAAIEEEKKEEEDRRTAVAERIEAVQFGLEDPTTPPPVRRPADLPPALRGFPKDKFGYPDWTAAADKGLIKPKGTLLGGREEGSTFDTDITFVINDRLMADVMFPHQKHTFWLSCSNCHPSIFKAKKGANQFGMDEIWKGEYCGKCHGTVAFMPKGFENCQKCHSVKKGRGL